MSLSWPLIYSTEGGERARLRRIVNHATKPLIRATPMMPPTTPPAIAPVFELLLEDNDTVEDVLGVVVVPPPTELGVTEALPVTSGESPTSCAAVLFQ
jgi:hypothetical protein